MAVKVVYLAFIWNLIRLIDADPGDYTYNEPSEICPTPYDPICSKCLYRSSSPFVHTTRLYIHAKHFLLVHADASDPTHFWDVDLDCSQPNTLRVRFFNYNNTNILPPNFRREQVLLSCSGLGSNQVGSVLEPYIYLASQLCSRIKHAMFNIGSSSSSDVYA